MRDLPRHSPEISAPLLVGRSSLIPFPKQNFFLYFLHYLKIGNGCFNKGFTLIEVIVTIIAAGIMGAIFINFMGTAMSRSTRSIELVRGEARVEAVAESIIADFVYEMNRDPFGAFAALQAKNYGSDVIVNLNDYISFNLSGGVISPVNNNTLRVKVTVIETGNSLTFLLTKNRPSGFASPPVAF
jgi:prepilin-type N-terminal cleavage/methylation domain-containing protein